LLATAQADRLRRCLLFPHLRGVTIGQRKTPAFPPGFFFVAETVAQTE